MINSDWRIISLLDIRDLSTTNMGVQRMQLFCGLFLIGLSLQYGLADISLKLKQNDRAYLPPHQEINEEPQHKFEESKYGNSKYQIFEVHNHYQNAQHDSHANSIAHSNFKGLDYLPPAQQHIRIQHINEPSNFNDHDLDLSFLSFATGEAPNEEQIIISEHVHTTSPPSTSIPIPFPSNYKHDFQKNKQSNRVNTQEVHIQEVKPVSTNHVAAKSSHFHSTPSSSVFRSQNYLPPPSYQKDDHHHHHHHQHQQHHHVQQQQHAYQVTHPVPQTPYKAPGYLPPIGDSIVTPAPVSYNNRVQDFSPSEPKVHPTVPYQKPTYHQPPHTDAQHSVPQQQPQLQVQQHHHHHHHDQQQHYHQQQQHTHTGHTNAFKGPDYLPPYNEAPQQQQPVSNQFKGSDYLPPHVETPLSQSPSQVQHFKGPGYLPPHPTQHAGQNIFAPHQEPSTELRASGYLPPGYDFANPEKDNAEHHHNHQHHHHTEQQPLIEQHPIPQPTPHHEVVNVPVETPYSAPGYLPPGYDFRNPEQDPPATNQNQLSHQQNFGGAQPEQGHFHGEPYLPPESRDLPRETASFAARPPQSLTYQMQQGHLIEEHHTTIVAPHNHGYLPPPPPPPQPQPQSSSSLGTGHAHMHSLSSYMTAIQPNIRYGDMQFSAPRMPFAQYGPPPVDHQHHHHQQQQQQQQPQQHQQQQELLPEVAPMYREQSSRPQYYAPAMSYYSTSALSEQAKLSLQQFMPQEVQQQIRTSAHSSIQNNGKIRTVQIVNPGIVKTLKVLETSDQDGVKTIKILGPSNENPMGEHRIVKVVSPNVQNAHVERVQTVKIYDDHKDVAGSNVPQVTVNNGYLPPKTTTTTNNSVLTTKRVIRTPNRPTQHDGATKGRGRQRYI